MNNQAYELLTLKDIFDSGKRQLNVPDYQRGYSWEEEQRKDLLGDITQIMTQDHRHFTGTVVASQNADSTVFDLVDGQQRITSLVIFMSCLLRAAKSKGLSEFKSESLDSIEGVYLRAGIATGNTTYQLQLGSIRDPLFHEVLDVGQPVNQMVKSKADQNIVDAAEQFEAHLVELDTTQLEAIYLAVTEKLGFLLYAPKKDAEIGIMFEVINNRGKPLSELEKIKNYLIYFAGRHGISDLKTKVNDNWPILLESLNTADYTSNDDENRFLRVCWLVFADHNKSKSYHVYDNLKRICPADDSSHWQKLSTFVEFITNTAKTYSRLFSSESSDLTNKEKIILQRIALHPANASILPLVVSVFSKERDSEVRAEILDVLEKLNFRFYVAGIANRNDSGQGELFEMAYYFYQGRFGEYDNPDGLGDADLLKQHLIKFIESKADDYKFVEYLTLDKDEEYDYYQWQGLKYFLGSYEDFLRSRNKQSPQLSKFLSPRNKDASNDFYHREHILAKADQTIIVDKDGLDINKRRLGNFIILMETINIKVSDDPIEKKIEDYFKDSKAQPNTLMIRELKQDFEKAVNITNESQEYTNKVKGYWRLVYQTFFDIREERMVNFAIKRWSVSGLKKTVSKVEINSRFETNEIFKCTPANKNQTSSSDDENIEI
ncbi:DUF262 domain-containing protein [Marinomonas sp. TI.3.20]|uniref:DUF262 domain-containing protein n=1 Tax=Marinomonas sp. TI.3.20 TaxID=3121296 RepID=UPI00311F4BDE